MVQDMVNMYNDGLSYKEIGSHYGRSKGWAIKKLKGLVKSRPAKRKLVNYKTILWDTKEERNQLIVDLYSQGDGGLVISKKLKISKRTVYKILKENNIQTIGQTKNTKKTNRNKAQELYDSGKSLSEVAKILDCDAETIRINISNLRDSADALSSIPFEAQLEVLSLARDEKLSSYKIAEQYGLSYQSIQHFLKRHNLSPGLYTEEWKEAVQRGIKKGGSSLEKKLSHILDSMGVEFETQFQIGGFRYDFKLNNVLIEVQGSYWHSKPQRIQRDEYKRKLAIKSGYKLLILWDYQLEKIEFIKGKIIAAITNVKYDFKKCIVEESKNQPEFLEKFHYQGKGRSGITIVAKDKQGISAVAVFTSVTRLESAKKQKVAKENILELARLCIDPSKQAKNFASWFLVRAIRLVKTANPNLEKLISFSDLTHGHDGTIYKATNWHFDGQTPASYWYYHRRNNKIFHKKTIWNKAKKSKTNEAEYAKSKNLLKVIGKKKNRYIWDFSSVSSKV